MTREEFERRYPMPDDADRLERSTSGSLMLRRPTVMTAMSGGDVVVQRGATARISGKVNGSLTVEAGGVAICEQRVNGDVIVRGAAYLGGMVNGCVRATPDAVVVIDGDVNGTIERH